MILVFDFPELTATVLARCKHDSACKGTIKFSMKSTYFLASICSCFSCDMASSSAAQFSFASTCMASNQNFTRRLLGRERFAP